ncbi:unnamed protein product, partial [Prorocentrum cordatum]
DSLGPCTVQLRGLPFRATIADIKAFLGEHAANLASTEPSIRLLLNRDGKPSGFARLQFTSPQAPWPPPPPARPPRGGAGPHRGRWVAVGASNCRRWHICREVFFRGVRPPGALDGPRDRQQNVSG